MDTVLSFDASSGVFGEECLILAEGEGAYRAERTGRYVYITVHRVVY